MYGYTCTFTHVHDHVHVASALFEEAICGSLLKEKTRILTLNSHYHLLQHADYIVVMEDGTISAKGSYEQVANMESFKHLISSMEETEEENDNDEGNSKSEDIISAAAVAVATNSPISSSKQVVLKEEGKEEKKEKVDELQGNSSTFSFFSVCIGPEFVCSLFLLFFAILEISLLLTVFHTCIGFFIVSSCSTFSCGCTCNFCNNIIKIVCST